MSLLLDALKKAADDKQKAAKIDLPHDESKSAATNTASHIDNPIDEQESLNNDDAGSESVSETVPEELTLQDSEDLVLGDHKSSDTDEALSIDELDLDVKGSDVEESSVTIPIDSDAEILSAQELKLEDGELERGRQTISDDALSMLIYKTNRDVKKSKRIVIFSVSFVSLLILVSGGVFYYLDMQAEIATLELKHRLAMQSMTSRTNSEKVPNQSEIIRNLVSEDSDLNQKVQFAKQQMENSANTNKVQANVTTPRSKSSTAVLSIQKTNKVDPVGESLDIAWSAYDEGRYKEAAESYNEVLKLEDNNRDALLGLAAIAVIEKNNNKARELYLTLLELDPRDPIATAAWSSLRSNQASFEKDKEYLLSMLEKNPDAHPLIFALGNIYAQQNKWDSAQQYYFEAWQRNSENADYLFNLAVSMDQLNKPDLAMNFYKECLLKAEDKQISFSRETVKKRINELVGPRS